MPSLLNKSGQTISSICEHLRACSRIRTTLFMLTYCVLSVGPRDTAPTHMYTLDWRLYGNYTALKIPFPRSHCTDRLHTYALSLAFNISRANPSASAKEMKNRDRAESAHPFAIRLSTYHGDIPTRNCSFRYKYKMVANSKNQKSTEKREKEKRR